MSFARLIASGGGVGHFPVAPGTAASVVATAIGVLTLRTHPALLPVLALAACLAGFWAVRETRDKGDPGWIVIDEFAGQWIALLGLRQFSLTGVIAAFALFRLFDILKPGPVGWADRQSGAFGVMADDVIAGLLAAVLLFLATGLFPSTLP